MRIIEKTRDYARYFRIIGNEIMRENERNRKKIEGMTKYFKKTGKILKNLLTKAFAFVILYESIHAMKNYGGT